MRSLLLISLLAVAAGGCGQNGAERVGGRSDDVHELTLLMPIGDRLQLLSFTDEVARLSDGRVRIRLVAPRHEAATDFEAQTIRDVRAGRADLGWAGARAWGEFGVAGLDALVAPLLIDSYELQERVLLSDLMTPLLRGLDRAGVVGIGALPGNMRLPIGFGRRLDSPRGFRGARIGQQQSPVAVETLRALGARPVAVPADGSGIAGLDGVEHRLVNLDGNRLDAEGTHVADVNLWPRPLVLFAGRRAWNRLDPADQEVLRDAARRAVAPTTAQIRHLDAEAAGNICRRGRTTVDVAGDERVRALRRAVEPVYVHLRRQAPTRSALAAIEAIKRDLGRPPEHIEACDPAERAATRQPTALDGVWRMETQRDAAEPDFLEENWGRWTFVFDRGAFAITQENRGACTWQYGTYTVEGQRMTWDFVDGGGDAPNNANNKPGEHFVFGFSTYRDTLTLTPENGEISPPGFRAEPWRRLSERPSRRYLSRRCPPPAAALRG